MTVPYVPSSDPLDVGNRPGDGPLRAGGINASTPQQRNEDLPSTPCAAAERQSEQLTIVRDLSAGPQRVYKQGEKYLPKSPGELVADYRDRLARSPYFNVFGHTIKGLVGQVFRRDPVMGDDVPAIIKTQAENIDLAGTHFDVFARDLLQDALTAGHCAVLVDFPPTQGAQNHASEMAQEIRPYWVPILKENILSWRTTTENGHLVLTQLVLRECTMVPDGRFGEKEQKRYRVFQRITGIVSVMVLEVTDDRRINVVVPPIPYPTQVEIPVSEIATSGRIGLFESDPPLFDLAKLNIAHYQQYSDYANSIHKTCVPIFVTVGLDQADGQPALVLGPNNALNLPIGGDAKYVAHDGAALNECKQSLDDLKSDMGTLGLSMLSPSKRTAETAQAKRLDKSTEDSALAVTARGLQDGLERALGFHARYLKLPSGGSVEINKQFDQQSMDATMLTAWTGAVRDAGLPPRLMVDAMQDGELISPDEDPDLIADEMAANAQAAQDAQAQAAQDRASLAMSAAKPKPTAGYDVVRGADGKASGVRAIA